VEALQTLGAKIGYTGKTGFPPLLIEEGNLPSAALNIKANIISQYISGLMMIAPLLPEGLLLHLESEAASEPYIAMTAALMREFGIRIDYQIPEIRIYPGEYLGTGIRVEPDWSSAAFFYQSMAFMRKGKIRLQKLAVHSIQGDAILAELYRQLGVETIPEGNDLILQPSGQITQNINIDFSAFPDLAIPVINTCAGLGVIGRFTGLESLKIKESDRVAALSSELAKMGFDFREVDEHEWVLINACTPGQTISPKEEVVEINHFDDHRLAMGFAVFALLGHRIKMKNPEVVTKSFPGFWDEFHKLIGN
jgi:3-phosphoshikimate 1-carboxyvinyltransferase